MSGPPQTPVGARGADAYLAGTPSPRKLREWNEGVAEASPRHNVARTQTQQLIKDILYDAQESTKTREATAFQLQETILSAMHHNGLTFEFAHELARVRNDLDAFVVRDDENENANVQLQELHQVLGTGQAADGEGNEVQNNTNNWEQALAQEGLVQGNGTVDSPLYTGAHDLKTAPDAVQVKIDANEDTSVATVQDIQLRLFQCFKDLVFQGYVSRRKTYMKLHPWAVINWVNFFTGLVLGTKGLSKINSILTAAHRANEHGDTYQDYNRARLLARNDTISRQERVLFDTIAHVIDTDMPKSNAYTKFVNSCACALLYSKFLALVKDVQTYPTGEVARSLQRQKAQGKSVRDMVVRGCAVNMQWSVEKFNELLERHSALSSCGLAFSGGFLLFVDDKMRAIIKNNVKSALPALIPIVKREFPQLEMICMHVYSTICKPLMSSDIEVSGKLAGKMIDISKGETDMVGRIGAIIE